jgi:kynurenine formamidase
MVIDAALPRYDDLPHNQTLNMHNSWGVFGQQDQLGTLNLLTPERVVRTLHEVRRGERFNLTVPLNVPSPWSNRGTYVHHMLRSRNGQDDYLDNFYLQSISQWDGLRHVQAREFGFYMGVSPEDAGPDGTKLGIEHFAEHGIIGRGVLLDVAAYMARQGTPLDPHQEYAIYPGLLETVAREQGSPLQTGDILMLRTGYMDAYLAASEDERALFRERHDCPGLYAGEETARYLWDKQVAAVCADNPAVEQVPGGPSIGYLHRRLIPMLGFALGELFTFESLAADCAADGRYTCLFIGVPLNIPGGVGSPANAIAIK